MTRDWSILNLLKSAAVFAALFVCVPTTVLAEDVTVTSAGGGLVLTGRVIGYDGKFLQLDTEYGPLTLAYDSVTCTGADCPNAANFVPELRFSGAARMADVLMPALAEAFARDRGWSAETMSESPTRLTVTLLDEAGAPMAIFSFHATNSDEGFADLIALEADFVMSVREVRDAEVTRASDVGLGRLDGTGQSRIVGLDGLVPVTAAGAEQTHIALRDVARAFRGELTHWSDIGGPDLPFSLHLGPSTDGQMQGFVDQIVAIDGQNMVAGVTRHATLQDLAAAVATTPGALSVMPYRKTGIVQQLALRDTCGFIATPSLTTLKTEDFPLTSPLFLYYPSRRMPAIVGEFLAFLRSPQAQLVVRRAGFVDQGAIPIPLDAQGQRFANAIAAAGSELPLVELQRMVGVLATRTRLSTSFRFEVGSTRLDAQSRSNLLNLAQAIRDRAYANQSLLFAGFSDGRGAADANRDLSAARAESVRRDLLELLGEPPSDVSLVTAAFGEALPMGCDDTEWGRQMNRRVELWVAQ